MAAFKFKLKVTDPNIIIESRIKRVIADKINLAANVVIQKIRPRLRPILAQYIKNSPEYHSLLGGDLQAELGPTDSSVASTIEYIIDKMTATVNVNVKFLSPFVNVMKGDITVSVFPKSIIDDIIAFPASSYSTNKGQKIPWAEWLLTLGDKIIVRHYTVDYGNTLGSRTGLAIMKRDPKRGWRVPPQFSGTRRDNFLHRALDNIADLIAYYLKLEFIRAL